jgi:hypothetical protein
VMPISFAAEATDRNNDPVSRDSVDIHLGWAVLGVPRHFWRPRLSLPVSLQEVISACRAQCSRVPAVAPLPPPRVGDQIVCDGRTKPPRSRIRQINSLVSRCRATVRDYGIGTGHTDLSRFRAFNDFYDSDPTNNQRNHLTALKSARDIAKS